MKTLLVYYSRTGVTKTLANSIAASLTCDVEELTDQKSREGFWGWLMAGKDAFFKSLTSIAPTKFDPRNYDVVIIGTPNWALNITPAIRTYFHQNKGKFKKVSFFCTHGGSPTKGLFASMQNACGLKPDAVLEIKMTEVNKGLHENKVKDFISAVKKSVAYYER